MFAKRQNNSQEAKSPKPVFIEERRKWGGLKMYMASLVLALSFLLIPAGSELLNPVASQTTVPTIQIIGVEEDVSVTVRTFNFPAYQTFTVTMGPMGSRGIGGYVVGTINSGTGGTFDATFPIPPALYGSYQIAVRLQTSHLYPYYAYNWFYNNTTAGTGGPAAPSPTPSTGYSGIPTFRIVEVVADDTVKIETNNFPAGQKFFVTMGPMGSKGIGGYAAGSFDTGAGGTLVLTFDIPAALHGSYQIAIRAQTTHAYPYYAYNWFYNNTTTGSPGTGGPPAPTTPSAGIPTMWISKVVRDSSVTFQTSNYPAGQTFNVYMGPMGSKGVGGIWAGQFHSGSGGTFEVTVPIPAELYGSTQIAVRAQTSHAYPYFSYNWFYNTTTP
jgi:hypothetical protein